MTEETETSIRVDDRTFAGREELARYVESFVGNRVYGPTELKAIQRLAALANGGAPENVHEIARATRFETEETDAAAERRASPFGDRITALDAERREKASELDDARDALQATRRKLRALDRRKTREDLSRAERRKITDEIRRLRRQLHEENDAVQVARKAAIRAKAAWNAARRAADRWRHDQRARFVVGPPEDRQVVDRAGLTEWLDSEAGR